MIYPKFLKEEDVIFYTLNFLKKVGLSEIIIINRKNI